MDCQICGKENSRVFVFLPIIQPNGSLVTVACIKCAKKSKAYCKKHETPHIGFEGGSTACIKCIEESILDLLSKSDEYVARLEQSLPEYEFNRLTYWSNDFSSLLDGNHLILRALVTYSFRFGVSIENVVTDIIKEQSVDEIMPPGY